MTAEERRARRSALRALQTIRTLVPRMAELSTELDPSRIPVAKAELRAGDRRLRNAFAAIARASVALEGPMTAGMDPAAAAKLHEALGRARAADDGLFLLDVVSAFLAVPA